LIAVAAAEFLRMQTGEIERSIVTVRVGEGPDLDNLSRSSIEVY